MNIEDVAWERFTAWRAPEQQRKLAIRTSVVRKIVVNDEDVTPFFHEVFRDAGRRIWRDIDKAGRIVVLDDNCHGVFHCSLFAQVSHYLGYGGSALPNRAIDAHDILSALIKYGVDCNGRLASLAVTQDQLALATPDRNQCVDGLQSGLQRYAHRCAIHDRRGGALNGQALFCGNRALAVKRIAQWVDHPPQQTISHWYVHDAPGTFHFVARVQVLVIPEQDNADFVFIDVEGNARQIAWECHDLIIANTGKT